MKRPARAKTQKAPLAAIYLGSVGACMASVRMWPTGTVGEPTGAAPSGPAGPHGSAPSGTVGGAPTSTVRINRYHHAAPADHVDIT